MPDYPKEYNFGPKNIIIFPPHGLEYIAAHIQDIADVRIIDNRFFNLKKITDEIKRFKPDYVGISCNYSMQIYHVNKIAKISKDNGAKTVVGGWHPTLIPEETLSFPWIDIIAHSEGELTFREMIQKDSPKGVKGLWYKENGKIIRNPFRELMDLNQIRYPARNIRDKKIKSRYHFFGMAFESMETSRGCPFRCKFCCIHNFYRHTYRCRSIPHIMGELRQIKNKCNQVYIIDDNFMVNPKHISGLCDAIIKEKLNMFFNTTARVDMVSKHPEIFEKMAKAGFIFLFLGIEAYSNRTLQNLKKQFKFREIKNAIKILHDLGYMIQGNVILGANFDDTEQDLQSTIEITKSLDLDFPTFSLLTPYPGTELMEEVMSKNLLLKKDWRDFNWFTPTIRYQNLTSEQLTEYINKAYKEVRFFNNPMGRFIRWYRARGLSFYISRICNLKNFKYLLSGIKNLVQN